MQSASARPLTARPTEAIDAAAFYETYFPLVYAFFRRRVSDTETAEDLTSEAFERILAALPRFEPQGDAETATRVWVYRIAGNLYKNTLRSWGRESARRREWIEGWQPSRDDRAGIDLGLALGEAVAELDAHERNVIGLRYWEGLTASEIAEVVGCSQREVYTVLERCVRQLRRRLTPPDKEHQSAGRNGSLLKLGRRGQPSERGTPLWRDGYGEARHFAAPIGAGRSSAAARVG
jgi:RNA polymerase sigma-70 factor (ECF subfamily)